MGVIASMYNHTFEHYRKTRVSDGQGGWKFPYALLGTVEGRIRPAFRAQEDVVASQERAVISHILYVGAGEDIQRGDRMVCDDGLVVDVEDVREPSRAGHHLEIDCVETQWEATEDDGA